MAKVLIIDDDDLVLDSCRAILEAAGFDVRTATNGRVGQQVFETDPADVVVCDIFMPEQDGIETIMKLTRDYIGARIIAMSGGSIGGLDLTATAKHFGAIALLKKPFSADELVDEVRSAIAVDE
jgi:two-component system response regulator (stage 0 sporulation protein F)